MTLPGWLETAMVVTAGALITFYLGSAISTLLWAHKHERANRRYAKHRRRGVADQPSEDNPKDPRP